MTQYILILFFHVGIAGTGDSNATTNIPGFTSEQECRLAGMQAKSLTRGTTKAAEFVCVKQTIGSWEL
jgi:hypothetical protein